MTARRGGIEWRMVPAGSAGAAAVLRAARLLATKEGWSMVMRKGDRVPVIVLEEQWANAPKEGE